MTPDDAKAQSGPSHSTGPSTSGGGRSSARSRYPRGRRRPRRSINPPRRGPTTSNAAPDVAGDENEPGNQHEPRAPLTPPFQPAKVESVQAAIDKVTAIIGDLRDVLNDMELVLEFLEDVERQQIADEREIEGLQQRLNTIHRRVDRRPPDARPPRRTAEDTAEAPS